MAPHRLPTIIALLLALALTAAACGVEGDPEVAEEEPDDDPEEEPEDVDDEDEDDEPDEPEDEPDELAGEITFSTLQLSPDFDDYIEGLIAEFEDEHPEVTVDWVDIPFEGAQERLLTDAATGELADVVNLNPDFAFPLAVEGEFMDLEAELDQELIDIYVEGAWDAFRYPNRDGAYAFPWYLSSEVTMFNADIMEEAGLDPDDPPESFPELFEQATQIADETEAYGWHPALENRFIEDLVKEGVEVFDEDATEVNLTDPAAIAYVEELQDLYEAGAVSSDYVVEGHRAEIEAYQAGEVGLFTSGPQFLGIVEENAPEIAEATGVGPQVVGETGAIDMAVMGLMVPIDTEHPDEALAFAEFMTNAENQLAFFDEAQVFPSVEDALEDERIADFETDDEREADAIRILGEQIAEGEMLRPVAVDDEVNSALIANAQEAVLGDISAEEALENAEMEVQDILDRRDAGVPEDLEDDG